MTGRRTIDVVGDAMRMRVLAGEKAGPRRRTQRCRHKSIPKDGTLPADAINVRRLDVWMSGNAQFIPAQIIYENEDNVGPRLQSGSNGLAEAGYRQDQHESPHENAESRVDPVIRPCRSGKNSFAQWLRGPVLQSLKTE